MTECHYDMKDYDKPTSENRIPLFLITSVQSNKLFVEGIVAINSSAQKSFFSSSFKSTNSVDVII